MKKLLLILPFLLGLTLFTSCLDDDDDENNDYVLASGTIVKPGDYFYIKTDEGLVLSPRYHSVNTAELEDGMRVLFYYSIIEEANDSETYDYYVRVSGLDEILTKPIFNFTAETTENVIDSIGDTPVQIIDTWFTDDYLNVQFGYYNDHKIHYINLVYDENNPTTENGEIILELKHNDNGDYWHHWGWGLASFDISQLKVDGKTSVDILVRSNDFNGEYTYNKILTYEFNDPAAQMAKESIKSQSVPMLKSGLK